MNEIYVVEMWSIDRRNDAWGSGEAHHVNEAHIASSEEGAREWCHDHLEPVGLREEKDYYPWCFKIFRKEIDEDSCCVVGGGTNDLVEEIYPDKILCDDEELVSKCHCTRTTCCCYCDDEEVTKDSYCSDCHEYVDDCECEVDDEYDWDENEKDNPRKLTLLEKLPNILRYIAKAIDEHFEENK